MDSRLRGNDVEVESSSSRRRGSKRCLRLHTDPATIHEARWIPAFAGMTGDDVGGSGGPAAKGPTKTHRAQADAPTRRVKPPPPSSSFPLQTSSSRRRGSKRYLRLHIDPARIHEALWIPAFAGMTKVRAYSRLRGNDSVGGNDPRARITRWERWPRREGPNQNPSRPGGRSHQLKPNPHAISA